MAAWVATHVIPHEPAVRAWLMRSRCQIDDIDELIQDAYCRLAMLDAVEHIDRPGAYFFSIVRNLRLRQMKRQRIVSIEAIAKIEACSDDQASSPEEVTASRLEYARFLKILAGLPERCRRIVELRKIEGWPQKRIAAHLGITEKAVEKQVWVGIRAIREALTMGAPPHAPEVARRRRQLP